MNCRRNAPFTPKSSGVYFIKTRASSLRQGDDLTREIGSNVVVWAPPPPPPSGPRARAAFSESFRPLRAGTMSRGPTLLARRQHLLSCPTFPRCVSIGRLFLPGLLLWWQPKGDFSEFINNSALTGEVLRRQQFSRSPGYAQALPESWASVPVPCQPRAPWRSVFSPGEAPALSPHRHCC